jgi:hypothetical protein
MITIKAAAILTKAGKVYTSPAPKRHFDIIIAMTKKGYPTTKVQRGFLTSEGKYVNRRQARVIAENANQLLPNNFGLKELYTEDVW